MSVPRVDLGEFTLFQSCRFSEFGVDGGPAAKAFQPKFDQLSKHLHAHSGFQVPEIEVSRLIQKTSDVPI